MTAPRPAYCWFAEGEGRRVVYETLVLYRTIWGCSWTIALSYCRLMKLSRSFKRKSNCGMFDVDTSRAPRKPRAAEPVSAQ
jgi:hypothetical protein